MPRRIAARVLAPEVGLDLAEVARRRTGCRGEVLIGQQLPAESMRRIAGVLRPLYIAWLAPYGAWKRDEDAFDRKADADVEPPVPPSRTAQTVWMT